MTSVDAKADAKAGKAVYDTNCAACHKDASYSAMPAIADIHANTTLTVCGSCHANTTTYPMTPAIVVPPVGQVPIHRTSRSESTFG